ncbi:MAG: PIN domain-containing protein [Treponema sp.]|jgi:predicted nucleic acid-binding protein|nr:PIN domain-containing protein [Treponema sp.]
MKKIVIDTNILMDFLFKREGHEKAAELFEYCFNEKIKGFICAHEIATLYYFLSKSVKDKIKTKKTLSSIINRFEIIEINAEILDKALVSEINDYEDAIIEVSSEKIKAEYILTKNIKDFKKSITKAITPEEFLALLK